MNEYQIPTRIKIARPIIKFLLRSIFHLLSPITIEGKENIPYGKPYIVAMNHVSLFDPPFITSFWPEMLEVIGAQTVFEKPGQRELLKSYGVIPVHRGNYDRALLDKLFSAISSGRPLLIAPEGGRSHETAMRRAKPGVAYIFEKAKVPIIPVGIIGTTSDYWKHAKRGKRPPLTLRIGAPFNLPPSISKGKDRHASRQLNSDLVMSHIARLLPEEYRGVYAENAVEHQ
ncbi:MAG: 1-acyl-sn-glycerol-3-phosphate acyltransferase [Anaerolineales bacterium]|uniref:1-acyl-sn-glycerol-3-phosphate acyltransferase n=1 Tax=Candidatus Desulfolinea nitratireducens TaxID=2841698 RepID=A0A8J6NJT0_9CHLR|nr:1-acyl-sn-glycerol-3-phosphate acyltransferase [Candidatus Desulfolinea nitratireducens]MBL6960134.1 1-acyl-sn-glycerol-3-phosphate acyltransferase [Anaerolineales bacterium]